VSGVSRVSGVLPPGLEPGGRFHEWNPEPTAFVACDLDGTFLGADDHPHPESLAAALVTLAAGIRFGFATGRLPAGIPLAPFAGVAAAGPHIAHNGAQVIAGSVPEAEAVWPLAEQQVLALGELCAELGLYGEFYQGSRMLVSTFDDRAEESWRTITGPPDGLVSDRWPGVAITKATLIAFDPIDADAAILRVQALGLTAEASTAPIFPGALIVNATAPGVSKGTALQHVLQAVGLPAQSAVAIGDGLNDLTMFELVGTAVAMANAPDAVRRRAHLVAPVGNGVAVALRALAAG
jgi:HAD superfamily hydrolase (TIGR01484 family)